jgi:hypothetical protein
MGLTALAVGDIGDFLYVIAALVCALVSWLGTKAKARKQTDQEPGEKDSVENVETLEKRPAAVPETAEPEWSPPMARPSPAAQSAYARPPAPPPASRPPGPPLTTRPQAPPAISLVRMLEAAAARGEPPRRHPVAIAKPQRSAPPKPPARPRPAPAIESPPSPPEWGLPSAHARAVSPAALRQAIVMAEILAPPVSLRDLPGIGRDI